MNIGNNLKNSLIADVENICEMKLSPKKKTLLKRCFELTLGAHFNLAKQAKKERTVTPDQFHNEVVELTRMSLRSLLFKYQIAYQIEKDPGMKKKREDAWKQTLKDLGQVFLLLDVAKDNEIELVSAKTVNGKVFDCSDITVSGGPEELDPDKLANLVIEYSKSGEK